MGFKFGEAVEMMKAGDCMRREGWNGKNQFVYYQGGSIISLDNISVEALRRHSENNGLHSVEIMGHFDIFTEQRVIQCGWIASQGDMQADDWIIVYPI